MNYPGWIQTEIGLGIALSIIVGWLIIAMSPWRGRFIAAIVLPAAILWTVYVFVSERASVALAGAPILYNLIALGWLRRTVVILKSRDPDKAKLLRAIGLVHFVVLVLGGAVAFGGMRYQIHGKRAFLARAHELCTQGRVEETYSGRVKAFFEYDRLRSEWNYEYYELPVECGPFVNETLQMFRGECPENLSAVRRCTCGSMRFPEDAPCDRSTCRLPKDKEYSSWPSERLLQCTDGGNSRPGSIAERMSNARFKECQVAPDRADEQSHVPSRLHADLDGDGVRDRLVRVFCGSGSPYEFGLFVFFSGGKHPPAYLFRGARHPPVSARMVDPDIEWNVVVKGSAEAAVLPPDAKGDAISFKGAGEFLYWDGKGLAVTVDEGAAEEEENQE